MMSMKNEAELREWILEGVPQRLRDTETYRQKSADMAVAMPAYRDRVSPAELDDLVAFYHAVSGTIWPQDARVERGLLMSKEAGCFSCHGFAGRIDMPNPGSFTGRIPAWHSPNYAHLVRDEDELREWIQDGVSKRIAANPIAMIFIKRQSIQMPAYRDKLTADQVNDIIAYIRWLRNTDAPGHQPSFTY